MGRHFTFGEASPPLGAFNAFFRWFPALKRRAGLTSPPLGAFANDDQGDRQEGLRPHAYRSSAHGKKESFHQRPSSSMRLRRTDSALPQTFVKYCLMWLAKFDPLLKS